jgi:putative membrane protein
MGPQIEAAPQSTMVPATDRTAMAVFRTHLALERTTLAWIRTTLTMGSFGFGMVGFFRSLRQANQSPETIRLHEAGVHFGQGLLLLGIMATVLAGLAHWAALRRLRRHELPALPQWPLSIAVGVMLALAGLWGLWSLVAR